MEKFHLNFSKYHLFHLQSNIILSFYDILDDILVYTLIAMGASNRNLNSRIKHIGGVDLKKKWDYSAYKWMLNNKLKANNL